MTAPEPLALEKFIKDVAAKYPHGGLVWLGDQSRYPRKVWVILDKFGDEGVRQTDYARRWEDLAEQFYGHAVVARDEAAELARMTALYAALARTQRELADANGKLLDETAELRAALEALAGSCVTNKVPHDNLWHMLVRTEVLARARLALAATEGSE